MAAARLVTGWREAQWQAEQRGLTRHGQAFLDAGVSLDTLHQGYSGLNALDIQRIVAGSSLHVVLVEPIAGEARAPKARAAMTADEVEAKRQRDREDYELNREKRCARAREKRASMTPAQLEQQRQRERDAHQLRRDRRRAQLAKGGDPV